MYVFDATPLIYLAKIGRLELLDSLPQRCLIPEPVYAEVVKRGLEENYPDARRVERAVDDGVLEQASVPDTETFDRLRGNDQLSDTDAGVLALVDHEDGTAVTDERYGRDVAETESIPTRGTAYLVLWLLREGHLSGTETGEIIDALLEAGWYCAPDLYKSIQRKIDELA